MSDSFELLTRVVDLLKWAMDEGYEVRSLQTGDFRGRDRFELTIWRDGKNLPPPSNPIVESLCCAPLALGD